MRLRVLLLGSLLPMAVAIAPTAVQAQRTHCRPNFLYLDECGARFDAARDARRVVARERADSRRVETAVRAEARRAAAVERADRERIERTDRIERQDRIRTRVDRSVFARRAATRVRVPEPRVRIDAPRIRIRPPRQ